jgi:hypothetical protein
MKNSKIHALDVHSGEGADRIDAALVAPGAATVPPHIGAGIGLLGILRLCLVGVICLTSIGFYTILPLAGLGLLPFLFFGCVCLATGTCDDLGLYR